jgi:hypothetical protein
VADHPPGGDGRAGAGDLGVRDAEKDGIRPAPIRASPERPFNLVTRLSQGLSQREADAAAADNGKPPACRGV